MKIFDITDKLKDNTIANYYVFNNSLVPIGNNKYMMVYRSIIYNLQEEFHPWQIWWDGFEIFRRKNVEIYEKNKHLFVNKKLYTESKYRKSISYDKFTHLETKYNVYSTNPIEYDSTGLAILEFINNEWKVIVNNNNLFQNEMNQDTRIIKDGNDYILTYNMFLKTNNDLYTVKMMKRKLIYNEKMNIVYLGMEKELLENYPRNNVEKNCVYDYNNNILYNINGDFIVYDEKNKQQITKKVDILKNIIKYYGDENIIFSLSTPSIKYKGKYLAVGHVKFCYKSEFTDSPLKKFIDKLDFTKIYKHGKFIYMMFFYEYDENYEITRLSHSFIPTINEDHLPYYLVFPMSFNKINDTEYLIGYGEGDTKCKVMIMTEDEIESLLKNTNELTVDTYNFLLLDEKYFEKQILHLGYFFHKNCGDDAFMEVFKYLNKKYYPEYNVDYKKIDGKYNINDYKLVLLGGGDVINDYFVNQVKKYNAKCNAVSVGIPYLGKKDLIENFESVIIRCKSDIDIISKINKNVIYYPDIVFLFDKFDKSKKLIKSNKMKIGIALCRTYYNSKYEYEYAEFIFQIVETIKLLLQNDYEIYLIPFGINDQNNYENDCILNEHIKSFFINNINVIDVSKEHYFNKNNYVYDIFHVVNSMDFMICSRFHSHIYSMICNVPFVSLSCSRKCKTLMTENNLLELYYQMKTNQIDIPVNINGKEIYEFMMSKIIAKEEIKNKINNIMTNINIKMNEFEKYWQDFIKNKLR